MLQLVSLHTAEIVWFRTDISPSLLLSCAEYVEQVLDIYAKIEYRQNVLDFLLHPNDMFLDDSSHLKPRTIR